MAKYLKKFENHADYEAAKSGLILPNVSLCVQENDVHYNPYVDPSGGHPYVEIGGIKWATMNVGANSVTDAGLFFQWGDTQGYTADQVGSGSGQKYFGWEDYKYGNGTSDPGETGMTKYTYINEDEPGDGLSVLQPSDDAARANWGGNWRIPTTEEFGALPMACDIEWVPDYQDSGVGGYLYTDFEDNSKVLFFPAYGYACNGNMEDVYQYGYAYYWLSDLDKTYGSIDKATSYDDDGDSRNIGFPHFRNYGMLIRPVMDA